MFYGRLYGKGGGVTYMGWFLEGKKDTMVGYGGVLGGLIHSFLVILTLTFSTKFLSKKYRQWWWRERAIWTGLLNRLKQSKCLKITCTFNCASTSLTFLYFLKCEWIAVKCHLSDTGTWRFHPQIPE